MKKILMIAGDFTEDYEVMVPYQTLRVCGYQVDVVCPDKKAGDVIKTAIHDFEGDQTYTEKPGHLFTLNRSFEDVNMLDYGALFITGGRAPEYLRLDMRVVGIVRFFMEINAPVAAICHGVQILTAANVVHGRTLTGYASVQPEVEMAGGRFIPMAADQAYVDDQLVTAPAWPGNVEILKKFIQLIEKVE